MVEDLCIGRRGRSASKWEGGGEMAAGIGGGESSEGRGEGRDRIFAS